MVIWLHFVDPTGYRPGGGKIHERHSLLMGFLKMARGHEGAVVANDGVGAEPGLDQPERARTPETGLGIRASAPIVDLSTLNFR
uniref:Uncharacterized protein n=1 Tax=Cereibacter sphaeroides (strain ATCC 17025 / ATH 2.4.3) TaxID=349102 RepID=A4X042_CERS5